MRCSTPAPSTGMMAYVAGDERDGGPTDLVSARATLLGCPGLGSAALRRGLVNLYDAWLQDKARQLGMGAGSGLAIVAVGSLGCAQVVPYSDLDLMVVHSDVTVGRLEHVAERLWYPLWDAHIGLDHSVRTVAEAQQAADEDMTVALGLLQARHIAGDAVLSAGLIESVRRQWRVGIRSRYEELVAHTRARWERSGNIAHRVEPDLKNGRGGLRDVELLDALAVAQLIDRCPGFPAGEPKSAHRRLLDIRTELHRLAGRRLDHLPAQYADDIGTALGIGDRFALARTVSGSARTIDYSVDIGLRLAAGVVARAHSRYPVRRGLAEGVVEAGGEVTLARGTSPDGDPGLLLRVAAAAAGSGIPISPMTMTRLARSAPALPEPWSCEVRNDFIALLGSGRGMVGVVEALDRTGLWTRLLPEWDAVRDLAPRDPVHNWTVDRHLLETAVHASRLATRVARPDLLVLGALLHDLGKSHDDDHSVAGARLAEHIGTRIGLPDKDVRMLGAMVAHHLLLPAVATRRDVTDPATIAAVVTAVEGNATLLGLLHALTEADSSATGPGVWNEWKATLIRQLVRGCELKPVGRPVPAPCRPVLVTVPEEPTDDDIEVSIVGDSDTNAHVVTVTGPDHADLLARTAGVLALHSLRVRSARSDTSRDRAVHFFVVSPTFGAPPEAALLREELIRVVAGRMDLLAELTHRERDRLARQPIALPRTGVPSTDTAPEPRVVWSYEQVVDDPTTTVGASVVVEVRAEDRMGLLCRLVTALRADKVDVLWARVATLGIIVVDTFGLDAPGDGETGRMRIERALLAACRPAAAGDRPVE